VIVLTVAAVVVALLAALLAADRVAVMRVQGRIAAHMGDWGFPAGPQVRIAGFPFLTQLAARRLSKVVICAAGKQLGPVQVKRLDVTLYGVRASRGGTGRTASRLSGTALVGFAGLADAGRTPGRAVCGGGIAVAAPAFLRDITFSLSALPLAMMIQSISVTSQGVQLHLAGRNVRFG
jgi:LmeA-like phospholipid-binding